MPSVAAIRSGSIPVLKLTAQPMPNTVNMIQAVARMT
jgi:hypothetical protein